MNITTNLDGEQVTIINVTGDESSESIVYIDSANNIKVKNVPLDWSRKITIATSAESNYPIVTSGGDYIFNGPIYSKKKVLASTRISTNLWDGVEAIVDQYIDNDGSIKSAGGYAISNYFDVSPGDKLLICNGESTLDKPGGYYNNTTWIAAISTSNTVDGIYTVPAGCNKIRITTKRKNQAGYVPVFIYKTDKKLSSVDYTYIASIGDSLCRGLKSSRPFTNVVAEYLGIPSSNINNNGIDSSTITSSTNNPISLRMSQISSAANFILFEGGGNDFNLKPAPLGVISATTNGTFYGALNICAKYLVDNFPFATIVWVTVPRWIGWSTPNPYGLTMDDYMNAFKSVAQKWGFVVADGYTKISIESYPIGKIIASDGAHINDIGHELLADIILKEIS